METAKYFEKGVNIFSSLLLFRYWRHNTLGLFFFASAEEVLIKDVDLAGFEIFHLAQLYGDHI